MSADAPTETPLTASPAPPASRLISVLESADLYTVKHPLQYGWSLWLKKPEAAKEAANAHASAGGLSSMEIWKRQVEHIGTVYTVEDFWWYRFPFIMLCKPISF